MSELNESNSMKDLLKELDREKNIITISKDIRKFRRIATIITGIEGNDYELQSIVSDLKKKIGTGGTAKAGQIILQGDHRGTVKNILIAKGFSEDKIELR